MARGRRQGVTQKGDYLHISSDKKKVSAKESGKVQVQAEVSTRESAKE